MVAWWLVALVALVVSDCAWRAQVGSIHRLWQWTASWRWALSCGVVFSGALCVLDSGGLSSLLHSKPWNDISAKMTATIRPCATYDFSKLTCQNAVKYVWQSTFFQALLAAHWSKGRNGKQHRPTRRFWFQFLWFFLEEVVVEQSTETSRFVLLVVPNPWFRRQTSGTAPFLLSIDIATILTALQAVTTSHRCKSN